MSVGKRMKKLTSVSQMRTAEKEGRENTVGSKLTKVFWGWGGSERKECLRVRKVCLQGLSDHKDLYESWENTYHA